MSENQNQSPNNDIGRQISETVRSALQSGDLSRLKNIGPAVQEAIKNNVNINIQTSQNTGKATQGESQPPAHRAASAPARPAWQGQSGVPTRAGKAPGPSAYTGAPSIVLGLAGAAVFGLLALFTGGFGLASMLAGAGLGGEVVAGGVFLAATFSSVLLAASGFSNHGLAGRVRKYMLLLEHKKVYSFDDIARITGRDAALVKKDVKKAMHKNMMPDVRLDMKETSVIYGADAYQQYLDAETGRKALEAEEAQQKRLFESDPDAAALAAFKTEGAACVTKIRAANDAIPGEAISGKLDHLETTTRKIFSYVEEHPEKLPDTRRFMNYYLPTTLKLVEKYREYDQMDVQVASVTKAKNDIENSLDKINAAFHNLLESLYQEDTLDVTTDIEVLEAMLEQEGLTRKGFPTGTQATNPANEQP